MPIPQRYLLDALRKLRGDALVTHPDDALGVRRVERVFTVRRGADETAYLVADGEYTGTVLVQQYTVGGDKQDVEIYQAYETLPGTWVPFTRYDELLGPIQGRSRSVINSGQAAVLGPTSRTTYQGRNGSSLVLIETQENWTSGGGTIDDPPFPIGTSDDYDKPRGPVQVTTQVVAATGSEVGSLVVAGGVATYTHYQELRQYAPFLVLKVVETWAVPGVGVPAETLNEDGTITLTTRTLELGSAIAEGEAIAIGKWIKTSSEAYSVGIRWKVVAERPVPGNPMVTTSITKDGDVQTETRTLSQLSTITTTTTIVGGVWTRTFEEAVSALVAWKIVQVRATAATLPSFSIEIPDPVPQQFRVLIPARTTSTTVIGTASMPTLLTGDLSRSQQQLDQFTYRLTVTNRNVAAGGELIDTVLTPDGQVAEEREKFAEGIQTILPDPMGLTLEAKVDNLGNNTSVKRTVTAPSLFTKATFKTEVADLLPREFQAALQTRETSVIVGGVTAAQPSLLPGDLEASEEQLSVQLVRRRRKNRDVSDPQPITGKQFLGGDGRLATVTKTLASGTQVLGPGPRMIRGTVDPIGDGTSVKEEVVADEAASEVLHPTTTNEQTSPIPRKFQRFTSDQTIEAIVETPNITPDPVGTNGIGVIESTATQFEKYRGRKRTRTRAGTTVSTVVEWRRNADGQMVQRNIDFGTNGTAPGLTALIEDAEVTALGDNQFLRRVEFKAGTFDKAAYEVSRPDTVPERFKGGGAAAAVGRTEHVYSGQANQPPVTLGATDLSKTERQLNAFEFRRDAVTRSRTWSDFPGLAGQEYNSELDIVEPYDEFISPSGTFLGQARRQITPLDNGLDLVKTVNASSAGVAIEAYLRSFEGTTNIDFPTELTAVTAYLEESAGGSSYGESGFTNFDGQVSGRIEGRGRADGSGASAYELGYTTKQLNGSNVPCVHFLFFVASGASRASILTKLSGYYGSTVKDWPRWNPQAASFVSTGSRVALQQSANAMAASGVRTDYTGAVIRYEVARSQGFGTGSDIAISTKVLRLPPTIHDTISVGGANGTSYAGTAFDVYAQVNLSVISTLSTLQTGRAGARVRPTLLVPTDGNTVLQTNDVRLYRLTGEPYKYGYVKMHAEVVNMDLLDNAVT